MRKAPILIRQVGSLVELKMSKYGLLRDNSLFRCEKI